MGFDAQTVKEVARMVDRNEYKRRQAPPGIRITPKAFGRDWRMPITNHFTNMVQEKPFDDNPSDAARKTHLCFRTERCPANMPCYNTTRAGAVGWLAI